MLKENSLFYNQLEKDRFILPLIALESYAIKKPFCKTEEDLLSLIYDILSTYCLGRELEPDDLQTFYDRLEAFNKERDEAAQNPPLKGASFGTSFTEYIQTLPIDQLLLRMCGYDYDNAKVLYCEVDRDEVICIARMYVTGLLEEHKVAMEACMYGFGGKYKGDRLAGDVRVHNLNASGGRQRLKELGF